MRHELLLRNLYIGIIKVLGVDLLILSNLGFYKIK